MLKGIQPEVLASEIEEELYKATEVDYMKAGRSLIFNLKDPNNGALRSRIFSKELSLATLVRS